MLSSRSLRILASTFLGLVAGAVSASAQTTISLNGTTRVDNGNGTYSYPTWKPIVAPSSWTYRTSDGYLWDPNNDQQTGQYDSDFAGANNLPSFFVQFGQINGVDVLAFRVIFNSYDANIANGTYSGNPVNVRIGMDVNRDGKLDLYVGPNFQSGAKAATFQLPGTGLNVSPSTTSTSTAFYPDSNASTLGGGTAALFSSSNFNYTLLNTASASTYYPGWTTQPESGSKTVDDAIMSWAVPIADINLALAEAAIAGNTTLGSISANSFLLWVAFTATQNNSVNQDAYGISASDNQSTRWDQFTTYMDAYGRPVPEPASYGAFLGLGLGGFFALRRRPARNSTRAT